MKPLLLASRCLLVCWSWHGQARPGRPRGHGAAANPSPGSCLDRFGRRSPGDEPALPVVLCRLPQECRDRSRRPLPHRLGRPRAAFQRAGRRRWLPADDRQEGRPRQGTDRRGALAARRRQARPETGFARASCSTPPAKPLAGARISAQMFKTDAFSGFSPDIFDPVAVTNLRGEFVLTSKSPITYADLKVEGNGVAPRIVPGRKPEANPHTIKMTAGRDAHRPPGSRRQAGLRSRSSGWCKPTEVRRRSWAIRRSGPTSTADSRS